MLQELNRRYISECQTGDYVFCDYHQPENHSGELLHVGYTKSPCDECQYEERREANTGHHEGAH